MKRPRFPYNPALTKRAQELRRNSTLTEVLLWQHLKGRQMRGYDFHRQKPLGNYIVDFFCSELALAIEIDGPVHGQTTVRDQQRQKEIEQLGVHFLRFSTEMVLRNPEAVLTTISHWIDQHIDQPPPPQKPKPGTIPD